MVEKVKKARAPSKPRATTASTKTTVAAKTGDVKPTFAKTPSHEAIAQLAYRFWSERGWKDGHHEQDWLRAERELRKTAS